MRGGKKVYSADLKNWLHKTSGHSRAHLPYVSSARSPLVLRSNSPNHLSIPIKILIIVFCGLWLTGCSAVYSSSFGCGDGKGATCMPMDKVDRLIASGEIERFTMEKGNNRCKGRRCKSLGVSGEAEELPLLKSSQAIETVIVDTDFVVDKQDK